MSHKLKIIEKSDLVETGIIKPEATKIITKETPDISISGMTFADKIAHSKLENRDDLKKVTSNPLLNKLGLNLTPYERPLKGSRMIVICNSQISTYEKKVANNPDYWKDQQITQVLVIKDEDYARLMRKKYEALKLSTPEQLNEAELVESLGIVVDQNLTIS